MFWYTLLYIPFTTKELNVLSGTNKQKTTLLNFKKKSTWIWSELAHIFEYKGFFNNSCACTFQARVDFDLCLWKPKNHFQKGEAPNFEISNKHFRTFQWKAINSYLFSKVLVEQYWMVNDVLVNRATFYIDIWPEKLWNCKRENCTDFFNTLFVKANLTLIFNMCITNFVHFVIIF